MKRPFRIAYLDDNPVHGATVERWLKPNNIQCSVHQNTDQFTEYLQECKTTDLIILDVDLEGTQSGLDVLDFIRNTLQLQIPVLMVSSRDGWKDALRALSAGADDFLGKPLSKQTLMIHLYRLLPPQSQHKPPPNYHPYRLDELCLSISLQGKDINLTDFEYSLASILFQHAGRIISKNDIVELLKDTTTYHPGAHIEPDIQRLKKKLLWRDGRQGWQLETIPHYGYRLISSEFDNQSSRVAPY